MPRPKKSTRLWLRKERVDKRTGKRIANAQWYIVDNGKRYPTGCLADEIEAAEERLAQHIAERYKPERRVRDIETIDVADVLSVYDDDKRDVIANKAKHDERIGRLASWWGGKMLSHVTGETCRAYTEWRMDEERNKRQIATRNAKANGKRPPVYSRPVSTGGARRDLEDLRAAVRHHSREGLHRGEVGVWLPPKGDSKTRWLTRSEAARLVWVCWRYKETQTRRTGSNVTKTITTSKRPLRHIARFIILGLYTGTRATALAAASPKRGPGKGFVDLDAGIYYRLPQGQRETKKRQPPVPLPEHLLSHLRRWARPDKNGNVPDCFVMWRGKPVASVKTGFKHACQIADLGVDVTPHTLRHTAATWLMQNGTPIWEAAGYLGMSTELVEKTYGHHHPDHLKAATKGFRPRKSGGISGD
jgi:integrase